LGEDVQKQTDSDFVGENTVKPQDTYFAGSSYQQQVKSSTDTPFIQESTNLASDNEFIGDDVQKQTDGFFTGRGYGK